MRQCILAGILILSSGCAARPRPAELDIPYSQAAVRAAEQSHSAYIEEVKGPLFQAFLQAVISCEVPLNAHVDIAIAIQAEGRVGAVYVSAPPEAERIMSRRTRCLERSFRKAKLPPPPETPLFYNLNTTLNLDW